MKQTFSLLVLIFAIIDIGIAKPGKHFLIETDDAAEEAGSDSGQDDYELVDGHPCKQHANKILDFFGGEHDSEEACNAKCDFSPLCVVGCIKDKLKQAGAGDAEISCVCKVIPSKFCTGLP